MDEIALRPNAVSNLPVATGRRCKTKRSRERYEPDHSIQREKGTLPNG